MKTGDIVNGYRLVKYIGDGGMASVWKAEKDGQAYAIKVCNNSDQESVKRFQREFRLMHAVNHKNVLKVYEQGEVNDQHYIIEELADMNLGKLVDNELTTTQKYSLAQQVCDGLEAIHSSGEIHRDIKPENILMKDGLVKIADFGIGRFIERDTTTLTMTADKFGSFAYSPPEVVEKGSDAFRQGSPLIDVYAIGCLLYYLFSDGSQPQFFNHNMVSADIYPVLAKCREYRPEDRYQSISEVRTAILGVIASKQRYKSMSALVQDQKKLSPSELTENALSLLYGASGKMELLANFQAFKSVWNIVYREKPDCPDTIAQFIIKTFKEDNTYWLQFQDTEIMARMAVLLCPAIKDPSLKVELLELCLTNAIGANRWDAIRDIHENLVMKWTEDSIKPYETYIRSSQDDFFRYAKIINVSLPQIVRQIIG